MENIFTAVVAVIVGCCCYHIRAVCILMKLARIEYVRRIRGVECIRIQKDRKKQTRIAQNNGKTQ